MKANREPARRKPRGRWPGGWYGVCELARTPKKEARTYPLDPSQISIHPQFTTKRHRTDRNRDTQTTDRRHKNTEQATGQARGHTHHSPLRRPTLKQRLSRPPSGPPSRGQPGRQRSPEPQRRPRAQAPAHHHARAAPHPTHAVHPAHPSTPQPVGCGATDAAPALAPQRHPSCASPVQRCNCAP